MGDLWQVIGNIAAGLHEQRADAIAEMIGRLASLDGFDAGSFAVSANIERAILEKLAEAWSEMPEIRPIEVSAALRASARAAKMVSGAETVDLVWTGPKTGLIPTRNTEQVILEVIGSARHDLFVVSYAFYKATAIVNGLLEAVRRGVRTKVLLESSIEDGGTIKGDGLKAMCDAVPGAKIYIWAPAERRPEGDGLGAVVHAKCAVADHQIAFVTSANLTSAALERNMELGLLIRGGNIPDRLHSHLEALINTRVITEY